MLKTTLTSLPREMTPLHLKSFFSAKLAAPKGDEYLGALPTSVYNHCPEVGFSSADVN